MKFEDIHNVAMVGAGTMGAGMSWCFAQAGYNVKLYDVSPQQLERACARIQAIQKLFVQEGLVATQAAQAARERIVTTTKLDESLARVQYVLEAAPEKLDLKQNLFRQMESLCPPDTILATNTS